MKTKKKIKDKQNKNNNPSPDPNSSRKGLKINHRVENPIQRKERNTHK